MKTAFIWLLSCLATQAALRGPAWLAAMARGDATVYTYTTNYVTNTWSFAVAELADQANNASIGLSVGGGILAVGCTVNGTSGIEVGLTNSNTHTWESWGVPSTGTVFAVNLANWSGAIARTNKLTGIGWRLAVLNAQSNAVHSSTWLYETNPARPWTTNLAGVSALSVSNAWISVPWASNQASTAEVRLQFVLGGTNGTSSVLWTNKFDDIKVGIAYYTTSSGVSETEPNMVQHVSTSSTHGGVVSDHGFFRIPLPEPTKLGNCLVLGAQADNAGAVVGVKDNQANTWTELVRTYDSGNGQNVWIFCALNVAAGTQLVTLTNNSGANISWTSAAITEFCRVASASALDGTNGNFANSATVTAGSITPSMTGDLIYQYAGRNCGTMSCTSITAGAQANITWKLLNGDTYDGIAAQWGVYNSVSPLTPTMTLSPATCYASSCVALKPSTAQGSPRSATMSIASIQHQSQPTGVELTNYLYMPSVGNLLVAAVSSGNWKFIPTNITDTAGNTWVEAAGGANTNTTFDSTTWWYAAGATPSPTNRLTVRYGATDASDATILFYDIVAANVSPYDTRTKSVGTQSSAGNLTEPPSLTPAVSGGLVLMMEQHEWNTATNLSGAGQLFDANWFTGMSESGPQNLDQNGGWAHFWPTDTSAIAFTWKFISTSLAISLWAADAISFKP